MSRFAALKRALYAGGRPGRLMRWWIALDVALYSRGWGTPHQAAVLLVPGRRSGRTHAVPIVIVDLGGRARIRRRGRDRRVRLTLVPVGERAPILRRYLAIAPGARPHVGVRREASVSDLHQVAGHHPVFRMDRT
ncbi:nitroreductase family deazaflavin-dependent oxidoreductase [Pseudactinotalea terrae]|uniref:nitroreductase family deazaflavin-dependent oxidoreductase n=1 Tax=Pseudactinotalea terrae TaxID=1743262 RepID=UPI0019D605E4|nr:nitroreductase family deazaflavin-dependent oxidoreductase [Pseudactinotalea terrae]